MVTYNVTTKIDNDIEDEWIIWQKEVNIPEIISIGLFYNYNFSRLLNHDEADGKTYVIQFYAKDIKAFETYAAHHSDKIKMDALKKWGNNFVVFESLLLAVQ